MERLCCTPSPMDTNNEKNQKSRTERNVEDWQQVTEECEVVSDALVETKNELSKERKKSATLQMKYDELEQRMEEIKKYLPFRKTSQCIQENLYLKSELERAYNANGQLREQIQRINITLDEQGKELTKVKLAHLEADHKIALLKEALRQQENETDWLVSLLNGSEQEKSRVTPSRLPESFERRSDNEESYAIGYRTLDNFPQVFPEDFDYPHNSSSPNGNDQVELEWESTGTYASSDSDDV